MVTGLHVRIFGGSKDGNAVTTTWRKQNGHELPR